MTGQPSELGSAVSIAAAIAAREVSAGEVLAEHLATIGAKNGELNAIVTLDEEGAWEAAKAADKAVAADMPLSPLHGVPFTVKDIIATAGLRTTLGSLLFAEHVPGHSASAVSRLKSAGLVLLGKSNCPEFALDIDTDNRLFGRTANPFSERHTPGGSSGGESAAVAAGCSALGIGTDYGGSIRWPAHCTGLAAIRPTGGYIPGTGQMPYTATGSNEEPQPVPAPCSMSLQASLQRIAPLARSAEDAWQALRIMAGPDGIDEQAVPVALGDPKDVELERMTVAWYESEGSRPVAAEVAATVAAAAEALADSGIRTVHRLPRGLERAEPLFTDFRAAEGVPDHMALAAGRLGSVSARIRALFEAGEETPVAAYRLLAADRDRLRSEILQQLEQTQLLLLPVAGSTAFEHDADPLRVDGQPIERFALLAASRAISLLNLPAAAVPCALSDQGLPIAVQIVGRPFHDHEVVAAAMRLERLFAGWQQVKPIDRELTG